MSDATNFVNAISGKSSYKNSISGSITSLSNGSNSCSGQLTGVLEIAGNIQDNNSINGGVTFPCPEQHEDYEGSYIVTPKKNGTILLTRDKLLTNDVIVLEVPYAAVSNQKGGYTVTIL